MQLFLSLSIGISLDEPSPVSFSQQGQFALIPRDIAPDNWLDDRSRADNSFDSFLPDDCRSAFSNFTLGEV